MQFLEQNSDEQLPDTTADIRKELAEPIITLLAYIQSLMEAGCEMLISEKQEIPTQYSWANRDMSAPELQILPVGCNSVIPVIHC